jgi:cytochrome c oxidase cbb3-type subunit IV
MISETLSSISDVAIYPVATLLVFFTAFLGVVIWTMRLRKSEVARISRLPLEDTFDPKAEGESYNG